MSTTGGPRDSVLLKVEDLKVHFPILSGFTRRVKGYVKAVDGVSFDVKERETMAVVGESGCGKTTLGRAILHAVEPTGGEIEFTMRDNSRAL